MEKEENRPVLSEGAVPFPADVPMLEKSETHCFANARSQSKTTFEENSIKRVM